MEFTLEVFQDRLDSTDPSFDQNDLTRGDAYKPISVQFERENGDTVKRKRAHREQRISNQTLPRLACQVFEQKIAELTDEEKANFPICQYKPGGQRFTGIYSNELKYKERSGKQSLEFMKYTNGERQFVFYCWNIFSTLLFVQECLKRWGNQGDKFVLSYSKKNNNGHNKTIVEASNAENSTASTADGTEPKDSNGKPLSRNLIYFGAPGTGKSFKLKENVENPDNHFIDKDENGKPRYERVTFYPTYSYAQFVGCYKPVMEGRSASGEDMSASSSIRGLTIDELAQKLRQIYDASESGEPGQTAAVLLFAEQYIDALNAHGKGIVKKVVEKAGLPASAYSSWLSAGIRLATFRARQNTKTAAEEIAYKFVPGPFLRILVQALNDHGNNYCLVIEEINRANAAAVFGDVFQLLDRATEDSMDKRVKKNESEYDVAASEDIRKYLAEVITSQEARKFLAVKTDNKGNWTECRLRIPSNMYIWATMNSADQGVFPMDTAFKRRWEFEYVGIDEGEGEVMGWKIAGKGYAWNDVRKFVNGLLSLHGVNEDKLMGTHFVKPANGSDTIAANSFESKVLMYLWEDAARMCRRQMFGDIKTFSGLLDEWRKKGVEILEKDTEINNLKGEAKTWYDILKNRSADKFEPDSEGQPQG